MPRRHQSQKVGAWKAAKSPGELPNERVEPRMLEQQQRTETSQYLEEKKLNRDSLSSGERTGTSLNRAGHRPGLRGRRYGMDGLEAEVL